MKYLERKLRDMLWRLRDIFILLPVRWKRILQHLHNGLIPDNKTHRAGHSPAGQRSAHWWIDLLFLLLDGLGLMDLYEIVTDLLKFNSRPLSHQELALAQSVFGDAIKRYWRIRIDRYALFGPMQFHFAYVSFYCINCWTNLSISTFIHEMVHVWQYEQIGAVYIPRALRAQRSAEGYNYGGADALIRKQQEGKSLWDFNLEQQADLVADYFNIREGLPPRWGNGTREHLPVYEYFLSEVQPSAV